MNKTILQVLIITIFILTACGQSPSATQTTPIPVVEQATSTPSPLPTSTQTSIPSPTLTASITSLPTIPTFTPTFDVSTIVTVTPAPKAECPKENIEISPNLNSFIAQEGLQLINDKAILDFLSSGGTLDATRSALIQAFKWFQPNMSIQKDVTGDGVDEFILTDNLVVYVFGCNKGKYQIWLKVSDEPNRLTSAQFLTPNDMNLNGIPEVVVNIQGHGGLGDTYRSLFIYEWDGSEFKSIIQSKEHNDNQYFPFAEMPFFPDAAIYDTDKDGVLELTLDSNLPLPISSRYAHLIPWRDEKHTYSWDGTSFILRQVEFTTPQYRFQAVQDADRAGMKGNDQEALTLYQGAIFKAELLPWSKDIYENEIAKSYAEDGHREMPTAVPLDSTEYSRLAAYAYYRIMLIHLVQNHESDATTVYNTLQQKFGNDPYGSPYVEMASAFWEAYQSTHKMYDGCAAAIQYAVEHPEILTPLGSDYHGAQSHIYVPEDVCPFR